MSWVPRTTFWQLLHFTVLFLGFLHLCPYVLGYFCTLFLNQLASLYLMLKKGRNVLSPHLSASRASRYKGWHMMCFIRFVFTVSTCYTRTLNLEQRTDKLIIEHLLPLKNTKLSKFKRLSNEKDYFIFQVHFFEALPDCYLRLAFS